MFWIIIFLILILSKNCIDSSLSLKIICASKTYGMKKLILYRKNILNLNWRNQKNASYFKAPVTKSLQATEGEVDALIYDLKNNCVKDFGTNDELN